MHPDVTVVHEGGSWDMFRWNDSTQTWEAPAGVHDELTAGPGPMGETWRLKHEDQSSRVFEDVDGFGGDDRLRLMKVYDPIEYPIEIHYQTTAPIRIMDITDAGGRMLNFEYNVGDRLNKIIDPDDANEPSIDQRAWSFEYDAFWRVNVIIDTMTFRNVIEYHASSRI